MHLSPSALDLAHRCRRQWAERYLRPWVPVPATKAQVLGSCIHEALRGPWRGRTVYEVDWMQVQGFADLDRRDQDTVAAEAPKRALPVLQYLPIGRDVWHRCEQPLATGWHENIGGHGFAWSERSARDLVVFSDGVLTLTDYKSTRGGRPKDDLGHPCGPYDPWLWAKSEEALRQDVQVLCYGCATMIECQRSELRCQWIYTLTDFDHTPRAIEVPFTLTWDDAVRDVQPWFELGRELVARAKEPPEAAPCSPEACAAFGGCPYHVGRGGPCNPCGDLGQLITQGLTKPENTLAGCANLIDPNQEDTVDTIAKLSEMCLAQPQLFVMLPKEQQDAIIAYRAVGVGCAPTPALPPQAPPAYANPPLAVPPPPPGQAPTPAKRGRPKKAEQGAVGGTPAPAPVGQGTPVPDPITHVPAPSAVDAAARQEVDPPLTLGDAVRALRALVTVCERAGLV